MYCVAYNEYGEVVAVGYNLYGTEITKEEYRTLLEEMIVKSDYVDKLYNKEITLINVPTEWQEEIQRRVNERIERQGELEEQPISSKEFYQMVEEVL